MPPCLHGLACVALPAADVLGPYLHFIVPFYVAALFVPIIFVFDRQLDVLRSVLVDLSKTVFLESHERSVDGNLMSSVLLSLQLPMPSSQLSSSRAVSNWLCLIVKASVLTV